MVKVKISLAPDAIMPQYAHTGDSGADLFSIEDHVLSPGETVTVHTGVTIELPPGYEAQVRSKSGLAANQSLSVLNSPGTVDNGYRGEIMVILHNSSLEFRRVTKGKKIAQLVVTPYVQAAFVVDDQLSTTDRGDGGLGSTGLGPCIGDNTLHGGKGPTGYVPLSRFVFDNEDGKRLEHRGDD